MNINLMNRNDSINNKIKEFEKVNNKRTISFIDTINNNPESFDYAGGIDEEKSYFSLDKILTSFLAVSIFFLIVSGFSIKPK